MKVKFLEEPAVEVRARMDGKNHKIVLDTKGKEMIQNENLRDNELVLIRIYKVDYRYTSGL